MDSVKGQFGMVKGVLLKTAEKVPEPIWAFKPTPEVRTFGQIVGHIADANLAICGDGSWRKGHPRQRREDHDHEGGPVEGARRFNRVLRQGHRRHG